MAQTNRSKAANTNSSDWLELEIPSRLPIIPLVSSVLFPGGVLSLQDQGAVLPHHVAAGRQAGAEHDNRRADTDRGPGGATEPPWPARPRARPKPLNPGNAIVIGRLGPFAGTAVGLPAQFGCACSCGLGTLLGTNELFFCCRERIWTFGGRWVGAGIRHWSWAIAGASTPRLTARSGLHTKNHVIIPKSLAGWGGRTRVIVQPAAA